MGARPSGGPPERADPTASVVYDEQKPTAVFGPVRVNVASPPTSVEGAMHLLD